MVHIIGESERLRKMQHFLDLYILTKVRRPFFQIVFGNSDNMKCSGLCSSFDFCLALVTKKGLNINLQPSKVFK